MKTQNNKTDLTAAFSQIRQRFADSLPQRASAMSEAVQQHNAAGMLRTVIVESHKLAGACGTFGYSMLGAMARQIEQLARVVQQRAVAEQEQAIPELINLVRQFERAVMQTMQTTDLDGKQAQVVSVAKDSVWLLLDNKPLAEEISVQLQGFGLQVQMFDEFSQLGARLREQTPAIVFSATTLQYGESLFKQSWLLNELAKQQSRLIVLADNDSFAMRVRVAQLRAEGMFFAPVNVPELIMQVSELLDYCNSSGRVYIVDDDKLLAEHYALVLTQVGIETRISSKIENIIDEVMQFQPDLILMDIYMPEYSGAEIAGVLRQYRSLKRIPIVFLSSEQNKSLQISAMSHGADDFITKPIDDVQLAQALKVRLARSLQLKNLIEKDSLTSLIKHGAIKDAANMEFMRAQRSKNPLSIVMLDIDHFKRVNDSYGHATGDTVITALATLLRKRIRKTDRAGRYGGEEFLLVLPDCPTEQAQQLAVQILESFAALHFNVQEQQFSCTFSAGVVSTHDQNFDGAAQMIAAADKALYQAKDAGRNQVKCGAT
ncbi:diguanylate cyclase [Rheinheimera hassiensis]|uniref:diguanylate cyclase n=1 Tax=Rheinheimera hassiensis TaxID=1193627 RepID=UPI001F05B2F6|nr:diguanylate cyclase [Rheinheimera hassiensis]